MFGSWNNDCSEDTEAGPKVLGREHNVESSESVRLPSKRTNAQEDPYTMWTLTSILGLLNNTVATDYGQVFPETLFLAITFTPPRLDQDFLNTSKSHYDKPDYHFIRCIRVSWMNDFNQTVEMYIVVCDSQESRARLKKYVLSRSYSVDESSMEGAISRDNSPISLIRSSERYVQTS